jgi:hypothetical protein
VFVNEPRRALQRPAGMGCACSSSVTRGLARAVDCRGAYARIAWSWRRRAASDRIGRRPLAADLTQPPKNFGLALSAPTRARGSKLPRVPAWYGLP